MILWYKLIESIIKLIEFNVIIKNFKILGNSGPNSLTDQRDVWERKCDNCHPSMCPGTLELDAAINCSKK